jgi:hypothetical protein
MSPNANDDYATTVMNSPVAIDVLANDTDPQNDPLAIIDITPPQHGSAALNDNGTPGGHHRRLHRLHPRDRLHRQRPVQLHHHRRRRPL